MTVQSQTQEHMDALTAAVNGASAAVYSGCGIYVYVYMYRFIYIYTYIYINVYNNL